MTNEFSGYEYGVGTIRGLRSFNVDQQGRLRGITFPAVWRPDVNTAKCGLSTDGGGMSYATKVIATDATTDGRCDNPEHGCGFWAYHDGSVYHTGDVHAVVEGSGKTTVGTRGFRCEKARIVALYVPQKAEPKAAEKKAWWKGWPLVNVVLGSALLLIAFGSALAGNWVVAAVDTVLGVLQGALFAAAWYRAARSTRPTYTFAVTEREYLSPALEAKVRRNYPDVEFFDSLAEMKKAYPVDPALEPTPENDPNFWDDDSPGGKISVSLSVNTPAYQASLMQAMNASYTRSFKPGGFSGGAA